jgi:hypothetical protein
MKQASPGERLFGLRDVDDFVSGVRWRLPKGREPGLPGGWRARKPVKPKMPPKPCACCAKPTSRRRAGRPVCLRCRVALDELNADKKMRRMGKLKGTHGA